jgi:hypothetical protein
MNEISQQFLGRLAELCREFKVELAVDSRVGLTAWAYSQYDGDGNLISDTINVEIGNWFNGA